MLDQVKNYVANTIYNAIKKSKDNYIGIELESFPIQIDPDSGKVSQPDLISKVGRGIFDIVLSFLNDQKYIEILNIDFQENEIITNFGKITFEPGGQIEFSSLKYPSLDNLFEDIKLFYDSIEAELKKFNIYLIRSGTNPYLALEKLKLQNNKLRYKSMTCYYSNYDPYGLYMMRGTCALQVNVDFGTESLMVKRTNVLNLLTPVLISLFANSPYHNGIKTGHYSNRNLIWYKMQSKGTSLPFEKFYSHNCKVDDIISDYVGFALSSEVLFIYNNKTSRYIAIDEKFTFLEWIKKGYKGIYPSIKDWETHLTTLFPPLRLRSYFEIRCIDTPQREWTLIPILFLYTIIYNSDCFKHVDEYLRCCANDLKNLYKYALYEGIRNHKIKKIIHELYKITENYIHRVCQNRMINECYSEFFEKYALNGSCQALDCLPRYKPK